MYRIAILFPLLTQVVYATPQFNCGHLIVRVINKTQQSCQLVKEVTTDSGYLIQSPRTLLLNSNEEHLFISEQGYLINGAMFTAYYQCGDDEFSVSNNMEHCDFLTDGYVGASLSSGMLKFRIERSASDSNYNDNIPGQITWVLNP